MNDDEELKELNDKLGQFSTLMWKMQIGFVKDPADSDYQAGYYACLNDLVNSFNDMFDYHSDHA